MGSQMGSLMEPLSAFPLDVTGCAPAVQTSPEAYVMDLFERYGSGEARATTQYPGDGTAT